MGRSTEGFGTRAALKAGGKSYGYYSLEKLEKQGMAAVSRMPFSIKVLLESVLRQVNGFDVREEDLHTLSRWNDPQSRTREIPFKPARVVMQDFTGVPAIVDLAAMRDAMASLGGDPRRINPVIPVDLVIDHSSRLTGTRPPGPWRPMPSWSLRGTASATSSSGGGRRPSQSSAWFPRPRGSCTR